MPVRPDETTGPFDMTSDIFIARQPILDGDRRTFGYELLYRSGPDSDGVYFADPDDASRCVIERAMLDWGMERIIGDRFGFINAGLGLLTSGMHRVLPPEGIILEVREDAPLSREEQQALASVRGEGFHVALDNVMSLAQVDRSMILPHASMAKIELSKTPRPILPQLVDRLKGANPGLLLVAEKVETPQEFAYAVDLGFDLFEGFFFAEPEVLSKSARPANAASAIALMAMLQDPNVDVADVEEAVGSDPTLAFRILAVVNSSAFGLNRRVESIRHAVVLLGLSHIRQLATLLTMSAATNGSGELAALGAVRGRLASLLAPSPEVAQSAFTVGLLSVTPALYCTPIEELVAELPLADEVSAALVDNEGQLGQLLRLVLACEQFDVDRIEQLAPGRLEEIRAAYADAVSWSDQLRTQLADPASRVRLPEPTVA